MKKIFAVLFLFTLTQAFGKSQGPSYVPGEVLVKVKSGFMGKFLAKKSLVGAQIIKKITLLSGHYLLLKGSSTSTLISEFKKMPEVLLAEPNFIYRASSMSPNDPLYGKLWGLHNTGTNEPDRNGDYSGRPGVKGADINVEKAWTITKGSKKVVVAVIDTGIDYHHPDLKNNMWVNEKEIPGNGVDDDKNGYVDDVHGWNAFTDNGNPMDGNSHGTHCAGTIGAEHNGIGVAGVMGEVSLMAVKFLSDSGSGTLVDAVEAIDYATKMNVDIMSNSWGGGGYSEALFQAIKTASMRGIVFVAAAGNDGSNNDSRPMYPASYEVENVISVASHTAQDEISSFSSYGRKSVHVIAPGSQVLSTVPQNQYKILSGTSMATPHVTGVVGLLLSETGRLPVDKLRLRLMETTTPIPAYRRYTKAQGRVNAYNFLTNTIITRPGPDESHWKVEELSEVFETPHPYEDNLKLTKTYTFPGAKYVKLVIEKMDTESGYDFVIIKDASGSVIEKLSGKSQNYETDYTETNSLKVEFSSDTSQTGWGVVIREAKVIY